MTAREPTRFSLLQSSTQVTWFHLIPRTLRTLRTLATPRAPALEDLELSFEDVSQQPRSLNTSRKLFLG